MPELPEAENVRTRLDKYGAGRTITHVRTTEDTIVFSGTTADEFATKMKGRKIRTAHRWGKYFWLELEGSPTFWPIFHLGMTGSVRFLEGEGGDVHGAASDSENQEEDEAENEEASILEADDDDAERLEETMEKEMKETANPPPLKKRKSSTISTRPDWPPRWWKFVLILDDGVQVSFADCRRLGRVFVHEGPNVMDHPSLKKLGFDAFLNVPAVEEFAALIARRSLPMKALLLNQAFAAGVGNWIADEVLYQARIHPETRANTLTQEQIHTLRDKLIFVVSTAVELKKQSKRLPENWLFHRRWSKAASKKETQTTLEGHAIAFATVGGRTSAYVPELQPAPPGFINDDESESKTPKKAKKSPKKSPKKAKKEESSEEMSDESSSDFESPHAPRSKSPRVSRQSTKILEADSENGEGSARKTKRKKSKKKQPVKRFECI